MKTVSTLALIIFLVACQAKDSNTANRDSLVAIAAKDSTSYTTVQWIDSVQDLGKMTGNGVQEIKFRFKNTGDHPLFVISANPSCGCTVADFPKEAISPGGEGTITAGFDTEHQHSGQVYKTITVQTNTKGNDNHTLVFRGEIVKEGEAVQPEKQDERPRKKKEVSFEPPKQDPPTKGQ